MERLSPPSVIAALAIMLSGCANHLYVDVSFVANEQELIAKCGDDMIREPLGCALSHSRGCTIVAYEPKSFDDRRRIETLGHELWHCIKGPKHT